MNNTTNTSPEVHTLDAAGKRLGRIASEAAVLLMGKHKADVVKHVARPVQVKIEHVGRLHLEERKRKQTTYDRYSGYPDGRRELTMQQVIDKKGVGEIVRKAVYGMLPANKLRAKRMKMLIISE